MRHLLSAAGEAALSALMRQPRLLLAFDFDGTLAPIVPRPDDARVPPGVAARLAALAAGWPVAVVTGRGVEDVRGRLGFEPRFIVGNHGAEGPDAGAPAAAPTLNALRAALRAAQGPLAEAGVTVEDKGASLALHFRLSRTRERAQALIGQTLAPLHDGLRVFGGKCVVNVMPADAPDKAVAVQALLARCGASAAFYAGDDVNDEPVFAAAARGWLTLRIGRDHPHSQARFFLDSPAEMPLVLDRMLAQRPPPAATSG